MTPPRKENNNSQNRITYLKITPVIRNFYVDYVRNTYISRQQKDK